MTSITAHPRYPARLLGVAVFWTVGLLGCAGWGQDRGSRPIEFSEPRDKSGTVTNAGNVGAERRRLTELEERLSKTLNFFKFDDSLSGVPAPQIPPRRTPAQPRQPQRSGAGMEEGTWSLFEGMDTLRELAEQEADAERSRDRDGRDAEESTSEHLFDSLRQEDWLVRGTFDDTFWTAPSFTGRDDPNSGALWEEPDEAEAQDALDFSERTAGFSQVNRLLGAPRIAGGPFGARPETDDAFVRADPADPYGLGRPAEARAAARRQDFRDLLEFGAKSPGSQVLPPFSGVGGAMPDLRDGSMASASPIALSPSPALRPSLEPRPSALGQPAVPAAPAAPRPPSVFDTVESEPLQPAPANSPASYGSPFRQPPARSF